MLRIRFQRLGKSKQPLYRLIVSDRLQDTQSGSTEIVGTYNPVTKDLQVQKERISYWIGAGAQPSATVNNLLVREGIIKGDKQKSVRISTKRKAKIAAKSGEEKK